jgi:hypothetical protein
MILLPGLSLDQIGHAPNRPKTDAIAQGFGTGFEAPTHPFQLGRLQARLAPGPTRLLEGFGATVFPGLMPTIDRLTMNAQASRHLGLANTLIEEFGGFQSPLFQLRKLLSVALNAFGISHARRLPYKANHVIYIMRKSVVAFLFSQMNRAGTTTRDRLPDFRLAPNEYGWTGKFPGGPWRIFGKEISVQINTRNLYYRSKQLPAVSANQVAIVHLIAAALPAIIKRVEKAMVKYNDFEPDFRKFIKDPHVWLSREKDDGETWAFVIERTDNPDFGYHTEFKGTNFVEIWAGD